MSRQSTDQLDANGVIVNGYDYNLQCWVRNYLVEPCGHPQSMKPHCCFSGDNSGKDIRMIEGHEIREIKI